MLEDDKLIGCHLELAKPGEKTRITPVKDVIEPRVKVSGGEIFPGVIEKCLHRLEVEEHMHYPAAVLLQWDES